MHLEGMERKYTGNNICSIGNEENVLEQVIDVYFDAFQKRYYFLNNPKFSVEINDQVIVETQMGLAIGKVISLKKAAIKIAAFSLITDFLNALRLSRSACPVCQ